MSGRWRPLPGSLDPEVAYLVGVLRGLKDRSGLSLAALARRTPYSKSSWERYLNGIKLPPRDAVDALARLTGQPVDRVHALWERAETRWSGRAAGPQPSGAEPESEAPAASRPTTAGRLPGPRGRSALAVAAAITGAAVLGALVRFTGILGGSAASEPTTPPYTVGCSGAQCAGHDPEAMACAVDAASFAVLTVGAASLHLRVSDACGAAWARAARVTPGDRVLVVARDGQSESVVIDADAAAAPYVYTRMLAAHRHSEVQACLEARDGGRRCTPWGADRPVPAPPVTAPPVPTW
ncbi:helix-turn-helix domain-containing protein [Gandjariella thermophila]|uniref:HTH cro/C1-type domain-containing protein n=1 Tax=Gandjariella thermophila TaxID=1931992 RepID=A0A4D4J0I5_9PSEU|nr:XRE family transcriptional regulator [Gandjariella thermophila]GDY30125.1 hypothetical protein GTS_17580 [Gandjariella thermophila]